ncbi:hypothetical protein GW17_00047966 [Ensete ventricosum]|nr:hypothetical protein GW17_00047966 [Ensete ventricosum]
MVVRGLTWLLDTTTKMLLANEILDLVLEIMTLLGVVPIIMVEIVIPPFVPYLRKHLHWVGVLESFFLDLEEDFNLGRVKRYRWQPRSWHFRKNFMVVDPLESPRLTARGVRQGPLSIQLGKTRDEGSRNGWENLAMTSGVPDLTSGGKHRPSTLVGRDGSGSSRGMSVLGRAVWGTDCGCIDGCANYGMCGILAYIILINAYTWWVKPRKASTMITSGPGFGTRGENPISLNNL